MAKHSRMPTRITQIANAIVVVCSAERLAITTKQAAMGASAGFVVRAKLSEVATVAAETRPYAIVVEQEIYDFGSAEFDALAKDLEAELLPCKPTIQQAVLTALLQEAAVRLG
jgi:hypothetical protein